MNDFHNGLDIKNIIENRDSAFRMSPDSELTEIRLSEFIDKHRKLVQNRYIKLKNAYENDYAIYHQKAKEEFKPDNRIGINFAKYITDTMNGYFLGNPIKIDCDDSKTADFVNTLNLYNDQDDNNAELSKLADIFGCAYEIYFLDKSGHIGITYVSPIESFMIYDDSILERPMYFVRYYRDAETNTDMGSVSNSYGVRHFKNEGVWRYTDDWAPHGFKELPASELLENAERKGIFESALPAINAYNKALSEKANDVDYFADSYLKVLGAKVNKEDIRFIRTSRIVNFGDEAEGNGLQVEFMEKPNADTTQENLINRLERLIFQSSMVCNILDDNFATSSGIALKFKLQPMSNLAKTKERKFVSMLNRRYRVIMGHILSKIPEDSWIKLRYTFTFDVPANLQDEAAVAQALEGIVSKETQLSVLSIVDNVKDEMNRIEEDETDIMKLSSFDDDEHVHELGNEFENSES